MEVLSTNEIEILTYTVAYLVKHGWVNDLCSYNPMWTKAGVKKTERDVQRYSYNPYDYKYNYYDNKIRIITFKSNNDYVHIATNIFNKKKDINYFKNKYGNRWNVEIYFKHIKKNSSINKITSHKLKTVNIVIKQDFRNYIL
jgi:hypothetical protein